MTRAVRFHEFGAPAVLSIDEIGEPHAGVGQVRIAVKTAAINPVDTKLRNGWLRDFIPITPPSGLGSDWAGIIDEVGDGVTNFDVGDEVFGMAHFCALAEHLVIEAVALARKPAELSWDVAGALPVAAGTGWNSATSVRLGPSDTVLASAAAGGVGCVGVQVARLTGAAVIGTASEANHDYLRSLGVIPVTYGPGLTDRVRALAPNGITAALEYHGTEVVQTALELGVPKDRINTIIGDEAAHGIGGVGGTGDPKDLETVAELFASGQLTYPIETFNLDQIVQAYERLETGHLHGKIVIRISS